MGTKRDGDGCYAAAMDDEPMFVLLARDPSAPPLVRQWASIRSLEISLGHRPASDQAQVNEAFALADRMVAWREDADESWRKQGQLFDVGQGLEAHEAFADVNTAVACRGLTQRQGDEIACSCGKRWGVDEVAPDGHL